MRGGNPPDDIKKKVISVDINSYNLHIGANITIDTFRNSETN